MFANFPELLMSKIDFVRRRRDLPADRVDDASQSVAAYAEELAAGGSDPSRSGPGKALALALRDGGVDVTDKQPVQEFVEQVNVNGGIDSLIRRIA